MIFNWFKEQCMDDNCCLLRLCDVNRNINLPISFSASNAHLLHHSSFHIISVGKIHFSLSLVLAFINLEYLINVFVFSNE